HYVFKYASHGDKTCFLFPGSSFLLRHFTQGKQCTFVTIKIFKNQYSVLYSNVGGYFGFGGIDVKIRSRLIVLIQIQVGKCIRTAGCKKYGKAQYKYK